MNKYQRTNSQPPAKIPPAQKIPAWAKCLVLVFGCLAIIAIIRFSSNESVKAPSEPASVASAPSLTTSSQSPASLPTIPGLEDRRFDSVVRGVAEREDPVVDGWDSERFSELANQQLKKIGKLITHPEDMKDAEIGKVVFDRYRIDVLAHSNFVAALGRA